MGSYGRTIVMQAYLSLTGCCLITLFLLEGVWSLKNEYKEQLPAWLLAQQSPLDGQKTQKWANQLTNSALLTDSSSQAFCSEAELLCQSELPSGWAVTDCYCCCIICCSDNAAPSDTQLFFLPHQLSQGATISLPDLENPIPSRSFLPDSIAHELVPLSPSRLPHLLHDFHVSANSSMAEAMGASLNLCTLLSSSTSICAASLESMVQFATFQLGTPSFKVLSSEVAGESMARIMSIKEVRVNNVTVVCHKLMFPFELHLCHGLFPTKVYDVEIMVLPSTNGPTKSDVVHGVAVCHLDTSAWRNALVFKALGVSPGKDTTVCHWILHGSLVWVPTP